MWQGKEHYRMHVLENNWETCPVLLLIVPEMGGQDLCLYVQNKD